MLCRVAADNSLWKSFKQLCLRDAAMVFHSHFSQLLKRSRPRSMDNLAGYPVRWKMDYVSKITSIATADQECAGFQKHLFFSLLAAGGILSFRPLCCTLLATVDILYHMRMQSLKFSHTCLTFISFREYRLPI